MLVRCFGAVLALFVSTIFARAEDAAYAKIQTSMGDIVVALDADKAPAAVKSFFEYATSGHYDRTIFHRVVAGRIIQGGGFSKGFIERPVRGPIPYEGDNGLKNARGAIAMARGDKPDSAQAQWFINLADNPDLDHRTTDLGPIFGYAVFGRVIEGMEVVDAIGAVPTGEGGPFDAEVPIDPVIIKRVDPVDWAEGE